MDLPSLHLPSSENHEFFRGLLPLLLLLLSSVSSSELWFRVWYRVTLSWDAGLSERTRVLRMDERNQEEDPREPGDWVPGVQNESTH